MAIDLRSSRAKSASPLHIGNPSVRALPELAGSELLNTIVWDQAALDKFRRYFLPKDTAGPPTYKADEDLVLGEIRRLAQCEPLRFTTCPPSWVRGNAKTIGYATLGDWCAFAIAARDRTRSARDHHANGAYKPYAAIGTISPIGPGNDWRHIDVDWLSGRVLAYAVLLTRDAAPSYARIVGMRKTASLSRVRGHFFGAVADRGRMVRVRPPWTDDCDYQAEGFLTIDDRWAFPVFRRGTDVAHLKRPYPFYAGDCLAKEADRCSPG
jgi:hypothetical protein